MYYTYFDHVLCKLVVIFSNYQKEVLNLQILLQKFIKNKNKIENHLKEIHKMYLLNKKSKDLLCE